GYQGFANPSFAANNSNNLFDAAHFMWFLGETLFRVLFTGIVLRATAAALMAIIAHSLNPFIVLDHHNPRSPLCSNNNSAQTRQTGSKPRSPHRQKVLPPK